MFCFLNFLLGRKVLFSCCLTLLPKLPYLFVAELHLGAVESLSLYSQTVLEPWHPFCFVWEHSMHHPAWLCKSFHHGAPEYKSVLRLRTYDRFQWRGIGSERIENCSHRLQQQFWAPKATAYRRLKCPESIRILPLKWRKFVSDSESIFFIQRHLGKMLSF